MKPFSRGTDAAMIGGATHVGLVRDENEDSYCVFGPDDGDWDFLIAVADGVGGHSHGKQASELALSAFHASLAASRFAACSSHIRDQIAAAVATANEAVYSAFTGDAAPHPATTLTCVVVMDRTCYMAHIGDSRAYTIHGGRIFQLSTDHTWVQQQVDAGAMGPEEAAQSPYRNQVLKALGSQRQVHADIVVRSVSPGDLFIVCSDGVTEHVSTGQILEYAASSGSVQDLARSLVLLAVAQGGSDNATLVAAAVPSAEADLGMSDPGRHITSEFPLP